MGNLITEVGGKVHRISKCGGKIGRHRQERRWMSENLSLPPPLTTVPAEGKVVLIVLIFDISSHFYRLCCGKAVMHMYAHVCTHRKDTTTCTFLLQKHTDNLYLCVHSVGGLPPHKYINSMQTHTWSQMRMSTCACPCAYITNHF